MSESAPGPDVPPPSPEPAVPPAALPAEEPPAPEATERLDQRVVVYWYVTGIVGLVVVGGVLATAVWFLELRFAELLGPWPRAVAWPLIALLALWTLISPPLAYALWRFTVTDRLLVARNGILFHEEKVIPITRLQHVDLTRGPVERVFGLATLVVYTAGTIGAYFRLPGLAAGRARELRDTILVRRGDDVV